MSTTDTLKLALEALEFLGNHYMGWPQQGMQAITTIKQALTAPVQSAERVEPMAWVDVDENGTMYSLRYWSEPDNRNEVALYRAPPNVATPQPAPVQEPHKNLSEHITQATNGRVYVDPVTGDVGIGTPVAQPVYTQEDLGRAFSKGFIEGEKMAILEAGLEKRWPCAKKGGEV